jgi:hypothetical protein
MERPLLTTGVAGAPVLSIDTMGQNRPWGDVRAMSGLPLRSSRIIQTGAVLTSKADEYRAKARECEELAQATCDSFIKEQFLEVAKKWWHMAAYEEKHSG